jgi:uncharacterized protein (TIGR02444 family)
MPHWVDPDSDLVRTARGLRIYLGDGYADEPPSWQFSLAFYAAPGVAQALLALQDRDGLDVNLMLFALWLGVSGRGRLDSEALAAGERAACAIRAGIVEPLRALRRSLGQNPDVDVQRIRDGVKALELAAEKLVQSRLARFAGPCDASRSRPARLAAAHDNLALYLGPERVGGAEAAVIRQALEAFTGED